MPTYLHRREIALRSIGCPVPADPTVWVVASKIADKGCRHIHGSHPPGTTCLGVMDHASNMANAYTPEFREKILNGECLCEPCSLQWALDADR